VAVCVSGEAGRSDAPVANAAFFVRALDAQLRRPQRPRSLRRALVWRLRHDLELMDGYWLLTMACAETIRARVATADDDDAFSGGENFFRRIKQVAVAALILLRQEFHRIVDPVQFPAPDFQVARMLCSAGENDGIISTTQIFDRNILSN